MVGQCTADLVTSLFILLAYVSSLHVAPSILQYLTKALGVDTVVFGYLQTTFAIVQLCGGPVYGRFGDQFGSRAALVMAFAAAATSYGLLGLAGSVWVLFLSRLPSMFMHAMQGESLTTALRCIKHLKVRPRKKIGSFL